MNWSSQCCILLVFVVDSYCWVTFFGHSYSRWTYNIERRMSDYFFSYARLTVESFGEKCRLATKQFIDKVEGVTGEFIQTKLKPGYKRTMWKVFLTSTIWWESTSYSASLPLIRICISASDSHARVEREGPLHRGCKSQSHQKKIKKIKKRWHLFLQRRQWTSSIPSVAVARAKRGQTKCWKSTKLFQSRLFFMETAWI